MLTTDPGVRLGISAIRHDPGTGDELPASREDGRR
jgi:hypothetical protein